MTRDNEHDAGKEVLKGTSEWSISFFKIPENNRRKDLIEKVEKTKQERERQIKEMREYIGSLDVLSVCYHGAVRSNDILQTLEEQFPRKVPLKMKNVGFLQLYMRLPAAARLSLEADQQVIVDSLAKEIGEAMAQAKCVVLYHDVSSLNYEFERNILRALLKSCQESGTPVFSLPDDIGRLYKYIESRPDIL